MAFLIDTLFRRSRTAGSVPPASEMKEGRLVFNEADGLLYWRDPTTGLARVSVRLDNIPALIAQALTTLEDRLGKPGAIALFATNTPPSGWIKANGPTLSRAVYSNLYGQIGTTWGIGDGTSATFSGPDLRGVFFRAWDDGKGLDPGRAFASFQADRLKSHGHAVSDPTHTHGAFKGTVAGGFTGGGGFNAVNNNAAVLTDPSATNIAIQSTGDVETNPKNYALLACVKY